MKYIAAAAFCLAIIASLIGCRKDNAGTINSKQTNQTDTIAYKIYSPAIKVDSCGGPGYLVDLDFDGTVDARLKLNCTSGEWNTNVNCGCWTFVFTTDIIFDTIFNSHFVPLSNTNLSCGNYFYDTIAPSNSIMMYSGVDAYVATTLCVGPPPYFLANSGGFLGFAKVSPGGNKYGWLQFHFDSSATLYLDAIALSNTAGQPIIAGRH